MYGQADFPALEGRLIWESQHYESSHPQKKEAWALLISTQNLLEAHNAVTNELGEYTPDKRMFQHVFVRRSVFELLALYWLTKFHCYNSTSGRIRFLYETYLLLRGLNEDQENAGRLWAATRDYIREQSKDGEVILEVIDTDATGLPDTTGLADILGDQKGQFGEVDDAFSKFYDIISNTGTHPHTITRSYVDGSYSSTLTADTLRAGLSLVFGIAAQYVRTYEGSPGKKRVHELVDQIFVDVRLALPEGLPAFLEDEIEFWGLE